ncbi:unnamed protein product [Absidia cylindrospora]
MITRTGIGALIIHCREINESLSSSVNWTIVKKFVRLVRPIPVVISGNINTPEQINTAKQNSGSKSVMIGREARRNLSCFNQNQTKEIDDIARRLIIKCRQINHPFAATKYDLLDMYAAAKKRQSLLYNNIKRATTMDALP